MVERFFKGLNRKGVSPVIAIVLLLMMTVAAAGAAYFWITSMQSSVQQSAGSQIEAITKQASTRIIAQATICTPVPPKKNLVGFWPFPEGSGCTTEDVSDQQNNGTLGNSTCGSPDTSEPGWVSGKLGEALDFDGTGDYVEIGDLCPPKSLTFATWVNYDQITGDGNYLVSVQGGAATGMRALRLMSGGVNWNVGNDGGDLFTASSSLPSTDTWFFLVGVLDTETSEIRLYVNGDIKDTTAISGDFTSPNINLEFSRRPDHTSYYHDGLLDEVRIYNRTLSQEEIKALYKVETEGLKKSKVRVTVYNAGAEEVPEGTWVANLKKNGNTIESDTYNASSLDSEERITLNFYFFKLHPGGEYTIELEGTETSTTVSC